MDPIIIVVILGAAAAAFVFLRKPKEKKEEEPKVQNYGPEAFAKAVESKIPLGSSISVGADIYKLEERAKYSEIEEEDEDETLISEEDYWWVLTLNDEVTGDIHYLCCERDDDDRWEFWLYRDITEEIEALEAFQAVSYDGDEGTPPKSFEYKGLTYKAVKGEFDETYYVTSHRHDRSTVSEYFIQCTEYQKYDRNGKKTDTMISFEIWDGGMSAAIGVQTDDVSYIP